MHEVQPPAESAVADLRPSELALLRALDMLGDRGQQWPTVAEAAAAAGLTLRSASAALRILKQRELALLRAGRCRINHAGIPLLSEHDLAFVESGRFS